MKDYAIHICGVREADRPKGANLATAKGNQEHVIEQVRQYGGFTVFWVTDTQKRAEAATRLQEAGVILPAEKQAPFPWCAYTLAEGV